MLRLLPSGAEAVQGLRVRLSRTLALPIYLTRKVRMGRCHTVLLAVAAFILVGCKSTPPKFGSYDNTTVAQAPAPTNGFVSAGLTNRLQSAWLQPAPDLFTLGPGDKLEIEVLGEPASRAMTVVAPDGKLYYNLLEGIDVWGLTLSQVKAQLEQGLSRFVREKPQVSIVLRGVESKRIWVLGRVQAPGVYPLAAPMTVLEAVSMAGGTLSLSAFQQQQVGGATDELADLRRSFILRSGKMLPVDFERLIQKGDLSQNVYLQPDDFIYFPPAAAREIYVLGAVTEPRAVPYRKGLTVASAVASAYGTVKGAYMYHVVVIRGGLSNPDMAVVNYRNVLKGNEPDIELQPHDIVYVPFAPYRYLQKYVELALETFVSSAAINAGVKAVGPQATAGTGVFIPVGSGVQILPPINPPPIR